jgi:hypothetical protein
MAVNAVEQSMEDAKNEEKKQAVMAYIAKKFGDKISPDDVDKIIECAVHEMNLQLEKNKPEEIKKEEV